MADDQKLYKDIIDNLPEGILVCDNFFRVIYANKTFESLVGKNKSELEKSAYRILLF